MLQIFCPGAASHMDLWEHKPMLEKFDGQPLPGEETFVSFQGKNGALMRSPWAFKPAGQNGKMFSTMLPHNLPTYVSIPDIRGEPPNGKANWSNGFLPAKHQAILMAAHQPIRNLSQPEAVGQKEEQGTRNLLKFLNERHAALRPEESDLQARIGADELAGRMQLSAPEVSDFKRERSGWSPELGCP